MTSYSRRHTTELLNGFKTIRPRSLAQLSSKGSNLVFLNPFQLFRSGGFTQFEPKSDVPKWEFQELNG